MFKRISRMVGAYAAVLMLTSGLSDGRTSENGTGSAIGFCWQVYSICTDASGGYEEWRTLCYSDLTACLRANPVTTCRPDAQSVCSEWHRGCRQDAEGDAEMERQCDDDVDACYLAYGC